MRLLAAVLLALSAAVLGRGAEERLPDTLVWMPMGDSITEGERDMGHPDRGDAATRGGYRYQLWRQLTEAGQPVRCVGFRTGHQGTEEVADNPAWAWHCGIYGGLIRPVSGNQYGAHRFNAESALEHAGHPDVITLMLGINDLSFLPSDDAAGIEAVFAGWVELASRLADLRPHSQVLVSTLLPVVPGNKSDGRFGPFNALIRAAAEAKSAPFDRPNVRLADVCRQAFGDAFDATLYKADGVHPNEQGSIRVAAAWREAFAEAIRALNAAPPAIVHLHNGVAGEVRVRLNRPAGAFVGGTLALTGGPTLTGGRLDPKDPRVLVFPCDRAFRNGEVSAATLVCGGLRAEADAAAIELLGSGAEANVPEMFREGFVRLSATDLATGARTAGEALPGAIARVGYYLELKRPGLPAQFVWVSMDARAFGNDPAQTGIPAAGGPARKAIVERLAVFGNRGNFAKSVTGGRGVIEFSPYTYTAADQPGFPAEAHAGAFGWNDTLASGGGLWGCMQVARIREGAAGDWTDPAAEMLFAYNGFLGADPGAEEIGIGSFSTHRDNLGNQIDAVYDWTHLSRLTRYVAYAPDAYERRVLEVWAEPQAPGQAEGPWALWTDFSDAASGASLPPQTAFDVGGVDAAAWRLGLGGGQAEGKALRTGGGAAPTLTFGGRALGVGYDSADALTVVAVVRGVPWREADGKPLIHVGDGTTGVGCALRVADGRPTLAGTWGNGVWGSCNVFPPADALDGEGSVCVAFTTGTRPVRMTVFPCEGGTPAWTAVTGLQGTGLGADRICFGNFVGATAGGLDFALERVAVFRGEASDAAIVAFARDGMARCGVDAVCTRFDAARTRLGLDTGALALAPVGSRAALTLPEDGAADWVAVWEALVDWPEACPPALTLSVLGNRLLATVRRAEANLTVLPMGDSITHGSSNGANWRRPLFDGFAADAWSVRSAGFWENLYSDALAAANAPALPECRRHNGISGQRIHTGGNRAGYLEGVANFLDAAGHPDVITLLIGTNDAGGDPAAAFAQWRALVRRLVALRPNAWVIVSPIIATRGQTEEDYKADAFRPAYNEAILSLFDVSERTVEADGAAVPCVLGVPNAAGRAAFGETAKVRLASMLDAIGFAERGAANPWFLDNVHPNQAGYNRMAAVWRAAIEQIAAREEGLREPLAVVAAWSPEGDCARVAVALNHNVVPDGLRLTVAGQEAEGLTLSEDGRVLTGALPQPLAAGREVALRLTARRAGQTAAETAEAAFAPAGLGAKANIPEAEGYIRVRWTPEGLRSAAVRDEAEAALDKDTVPDFDRVAYYLELARPGGPVRTVWVSAAAAPGALPLGLPDAVLQADLSDAHVFGNAFPEAAGPAACFVAFAPGSAGSADGAAGLPDGLAGWYDWNDTLNAAGAYGIFQFWLRTAEAATPATLLFAYNRWGSDSGEDEVLIGDLATHSSGRTPSVNGVFLDEFAEAFTFGAYAVRNLEIWVRPTPPPKPNGAADDASAYSPAAAATLTRVNGNVVPSAVRALGNGRPLDAAATSEALACLDGIAHADGEGGVEVCYDFAVTDLTFDGGRLAVAAALRAPAGASFVPGTTFRLRSVSDDRVLGVSEAVGPDGRSITITAPQETEGGLFRVEACRSASPLAAEAAQGG